MTAYAVWTLRYSTRGAGSYSFDVLRGIFLKRETADKTAHGYQRQWESEGILYGEPSVCAIVREIHIDES